MSTLVLRRAEVDARGRLRRSVAPASETWPPGNAELYRAFLRWLDPNGVPAARARTVLVAVRHLLAALPLSGAPDALAAASRALLRDYATRGAASGTLQQYGTALRLFQRFVAIQIGLPPAVPTPPTPGCRRTCKSGGIWTGARQVEDGAAFCRASAARRR
jgi:hypothetical protein